MSIGEVCNREVVIAEKTFSVGQVAKLMRHHHVGDVVIVESVGDRRRPIGIVTDRDIAVAVVALDLSPRLLSAGDIMVQELTCAVEHHGVWDTLRVMRSKGVRRMPVVDRDGWLVGIVTLDDLMELLAEELVEMVKLITTERRREEVGRQP